MIRCVKLGEKEMTDQIQHKILLNREKALSELIVGFIFPNIFTFYCVIEVVCLFDFTPAICCHRDFQI